MTPRSSQGGLAGLFASALRADDVSERVAAGAGLSFADFLTSPDYAGPYLGGRPPSPVVRALVDVSEGRAPEAIDDAIAQRIFRCSRLDLGTGIVPRVVVLGAGRRGGKTSRLLAPKMVHAAWTVPLPDLAPGEIARSLVIAPDLDLADACFHYAKGICESSPVLRTAIVKSNTEEIILRRPDGRLCELVTGAANRGGKAGRSRTLVFAGLDEAAFFYAADGHTVNDRAIYEAILPGFGIPPAPGAQLWITSTPWIEGAGLMEELIDEHWGQPGRVLVAARVSSYALRGIPDDGCLREGYDEDTYRREILAEPLPAGSTSFFNGQAVQRAMERTFDGAVVALGAGGDFALERDLSASVVVRRLVGGLFSVPARGLAAADARAEGLKGSQVAALLAKPLQRHGVRAMTVDGHSFAAMSEHFDALGLRIDKCPPTHDFKVESWTALRDLFDEDRIALGELAEGERDWLMMQLRQVVAKRLPMGRIDVSIPRLSARQEATAAARGQLHRGHADAAAALVLGAVEAGSMDRVRWGEMPRRPHPSPPTATKPIPQRPRAYDPRRIGRLR